HRLLNDPAGALLIGADALHAGVFHRGLNGFFINRIEIDVLSARGILLRAKRHQDEAQGLFSGLHVLSILAEYEVPTRLPRHSAADATGWLQRRPDGRPVISAWLAPSRRPGSRIFFGFSGRTGSSQANSPAAPTPASTFRHRGVDVFTPSPE